MYKRIVMIGIILLLIMIGNNHVASAYETGSLMSEKELYETNEDIRIIDMSPSCVYQEGHIPGAVNFYREDISNPNALIPFMLAPTLQIEELMAKIGVEENQTILIYGQTPFDATRLWWILKLYGHENVIVLNGNLETWEANGYPLSKDISEYPKTEYRIDPNKIKIKMIAHINNVIEQMNKDTVLIDARDTDAYEGRIVAEGAERKGRIPNAINIPWEIHFDEDGRFKTVEELRDIYTKNGVHEGTSMITYCHSGFQSTVNFFAITELLGYKNASNFDASWIGWSGDVRLPIESDYCSFTVGNQQFELKGKQQTMDAVPYIKEDSMLAPLRYLALTLGIEDSDMEVQGKKMNLKKDGNIIELEVGSDKIRSNGVEQQLNIEPEVLQTGQIMVPVRSIAEVLGAVVSWDEITKTTFIYLKEKSEPNVSSKNTAPT